MGKVETMKELIRKFESYDAMSYFYDPECQDAFHEMWAYAHENGFVSEKGAISVE